MAKKEEKKPLIDKFSTMSTEDLLGIIDSYHADTDEARDKRDETEEKKLAANQNVEDIESNYFVEKRGSQPRYQNRPRTRGLKNHEEATELIYHIAIEGIRQDMGEDIAKFYKDNPQKIAQFLLGRGIDMFKLKQDLLKHKRNVNQSEEYRKFKESMVSIDEEVEKFFAQQHLARDHRHYEPLVKAANKYTSKYGLQLAEGLRGDEILSHYIAGVGNVLGGEYFSKHEGHFKKKKKD